MSVMRCFGNGQQSDDYRIPAPPSKSASHRAMICAALADGTTTLTNFAYSQDMEATLRCIEALGASCVRGEDTVTITGICRANKTAVLDCGESGSTLRFFIPIAAALGCEATFIGEGKLPTRPINALIEAMTPHGVAFDYQNTTPFSISGTLTGGDIFIAGDISSQYVTGLLFAAPLLKEDTRIHLTTKLTSRSYVDMTVMMMQDFGIELSETEDGWFVRGSQKYRAKTIYPVECDYSNAAFALTAGAVGRTPIIVTGLNPHSTQGDRAILTLLARFGASVETLPEGEVRVSPGALKAITIDAEDIPDLVPILCVAASCAEGETCIAHVGRLRYKESDRLAAMADSITRLGGTVRVTEDEIYITGTQLRGGKISGYNDHRIVMSMAIAALRASEPVDIEGYTAVNKSYPNFFEIFNTFGGESHVLSLE